MAQGAVISQFPPGTPPRPRNFPRRNYLMTAWSSKVLVVAAGRRSPALGMAKWAKALGKELYAVPNDIYRRESQGTNGLIARGAKIYLTPKQLLGGIKLQRSSLAPSKDKAQRPIEKEKKPIEASSPLELEILNALSRGKITLAALAQLVAVPGRDLLETVFILQLEGKVRLLPGGFIKGSVPGS